MAGRTDARTAMAPAPMLAVLLVVAAIAMRGYLPGAQPVTREPAADNPAALIVVIGLLIAAVAVVVLAVVTRARQRTAARASTSTRPDWLRGDVGRPTWRAALIVFAVVVGWLLIAMLLSRLGGGAALTPPSSAPGGAAASNVPDPGSVATDSAPPDLPSTGNLLGYFYAATVVFLLVLVFGSIVAMRRAARPAPSTPPARRAESRRVAADDSESLTRAAEVGLAAVEDLSREPRKAIIACYAAMERELARVPGAAPQSFDTASEVLERAVDQHALGPDTATELVDLFDEARFSPHVMNEGHREVAAQALQRVLSELTART